mmetsp:Transcript_28410/g.64409  ORF Transcript_28410/g.64409 Transcript_28410/m.64409 type:complete len:174 (-) Transcript_28410:1007-1528(-)
MPSGFLRAIISRSRSALLLDGLGFRSLQERFAEFSSEGLSRSAEEGRDEGFTDLEGSREIGGSAQGLSRSTELGFLWRSAEEGREEEVAFQGRSRSAEEGRDDEREEAPEAGAGASLDEPGRGLTDRDRWFDVICACLFFTYAVGSNRWNGRAGGGVGRRRSAEEGRDPELFP